MIGLYPLCAGMTNPTGSPPGSSAIFHQSRGLAYCASSSW